MPVALRRHDSPHYALSALHSLPCGCVAAVFLVQPADAEVISLEARGPHCLDAQHQAGQVVGLGLPVVDRLGR